MSAQSAVRLQQQQHHCAGQVRSKAPRLARVAALVGGTRRPSSSGKRASRIVCFTSQAQETAQARTPTQTTASPRAGGASHQRQLTVSWAGAGLYFFWQLGAMKFLAEKFDLTRVPMVGASGGALAAALAACGVDADRVLEHAYQLSIKHNIWERPLGLMGIWGSLIEQWLDELLPDNAHELCRGRVTVVVTTLPDMSQVGISDFQDKADLINACMASSHIPWLLDWSATRPCRGRRCVDGSFPDFFTGENCELLRRGASSGQAVVFDYFDDVALQRKGRLDMLELKSYDEIRRRYRLGYEYAARLHADGRFDHFELAELYAMGEEEGLSEVLVPEHSQHHSGAATVAAAAGSTTGNRASSHAGTPVLTGASTPHSHSHGLVLELQQQAQAQ